MQALKNGKFELFSDKYSLISYSKLIRSIKNINISNLSEWQHDMLKMTGDIYYKAKAKDDLISYFHDDIKSLEAYDELLSLKLIDTYGRDSLYKDSCNECFYYGYHTLSSEYKYHGAGCVLSIFEGIFFLISLYFISILTLEYLFSGSYTPYILENSLSEEAIAISIFLSFVVNYFLFSKFISPVLDCFNKANGSVLVCPACQNRKSYSFFVWLVNEYLK